MMEPSGLVLEESLKPRLPLATSATTDIDAAVSMGASSSASMSVMENPGLGDMSDPNQSTVHVGNNQELISLSHELNILLDPKNNLSTPPPLISLSPFECTKLQQEELETLTAIFGEDIHCLSESCFIVDIKYLANDIQDEDVIKIWFSFPPNYPTVPPIFELEASQSGVCSYNDADELYDCFVAESFKRIGEMMIFDLVTMAQEFMTSLVERKEQLAKEQQIADQQHKERMEAEEAARKPKPLNKGIQNDDVPAPMTSTVGEKVDALLCSGKVLKPTQFIGRISEVIKKLPEDLKIIRIENVLRQDLAERFCKTLKDVSEKLWKKERLFPHEINLKPQIGFHGTLTSNLPSIVQRGLVIPGRSNEVKVRCGSSLGLGIYLSPSAQYSLGYSSSNRLIVCAAIQGRIYKEGILKSHASHCRINCVISHCGNEWVFFNAGQVLPCYVIQVAKCDPRKPQPPPLHQLIHEDTATSATHRKEALLARARKFLPYGFGPGSKTVIEDAASFDDDEEDYGEYQESRHKETLEVQSELQDYRYKYS